MSVLKIKRRDASVRLSSVIRLRLTPDNYACASFVSSVIWTQMPAHYKLALYLAAALITATPFAGAQEDKAKDDKASFDPKQAKDGGLGMPTTYDKFIALDQLVPSGEINWNQTFRKVAVDIDPDQFTDKDTVIPMVLGIRIADGVMA